MSRAITEEIKMFNETLSQYLTAIGTMPRLLPEHDATATKGELINGNLRLVVAIAKQRTRRTTEDLLDVIQDGNAGLIIAAERYDHTQGSFGNYAGFHIRNSIAEGQIVMSRTVRLPRVVFKNHRKIKELEAQGWSAEQIAEKLDIKAHQVAAALSYEMGEVYDDTAECQQETPEDAAEGYLLERRIKRNLTPKQRNIVSRTLRGCDAKEIAEADGKTATGVRRVKADAVAALRCTTRAPDPLDPPRLATPKKATPPKKVQPVRGIDDAHRDVQRIVNTTAEYLGAQVSELLSHRGRSNVYARQMAMYLARRTTKRSLNEIGADFKRDHTTVIHAVEKISRLRENDPIAENDIVALIALLDKRVGI